MALVRCPNCGRVADGKSCFACGYDWPAAGAAPAAVTKPPTPSSSFKVPSPSSSFKIPSPSSFPTAAVVAKHEDIDINLDADIELDNQPQGLAPFPAQTAAQTATARAPTPGAGPRPTSLPQESPTATGFPVEPTPFAVAAPPAFPSAFPATPSHAQAFPSAFPAPAPPSAFPEVGFAGSPPVAFSQPAAGSQPPSFPGFPPPAFPSGGWPEPNAAGPAGFPPAFPAPSGSWGAPPPPAIAPAFPSPSGNWGPPPAFEQPGDPLPPPAATPAPSAPVPPPALNGLFDGLDAPVASADLDVAVTEERSIVPGTLEDFPTSGFVAPPVSALDNTVRDSTQDAGDFFNFTLEPGATLEPRPAADISPFEAQAPVVDAVVDVDADAAVEVDDLDVSFELPNALPTETSSDLPDFPPPGISANPPSGGPGFAELDNFDLDGPAPAAAPPVPAEDDFSMAALDAMGDPDPAAPLAEMPPPPPAFAEDDFSIGLDEPTAPVETEAFRPAPPPTGPTISTRVGKLAESLEDGGRIADAALLYEVQAVLASLGR